ncbi:MAG: hypothetical protein NZ954_09065, partial [Thermofilaceae archaeon]|nr:hypothetical protein [Thermofilaceae archaeon]
PVIDIEAEEGRKEVRPPTEYTPPPSATVAGYTPPPQPVQPSSTTVLPVGKPLPVMDIEYTPPSPAPSPEDWSTTLAYRRQLEAAASREEVESILGKLRRYGYTVESRGIYPEGGRGLWTERVLVGEPGTGEWFVVDFLRDFQFFPSCICIIM